MKRKEIDKEGLNEIIHLSKNLLRVIYVIVILGIILGAIMFLKQLNVLPFLGGMFKVLSPLFIGFIIAWLFYPLEKKLEEAGLNKYLASMVIIFGLLLLIILLVYIFIPVLYNEVNELIKTLPSIFSNLSGFITGALDNIKIVGVDTLKIKNNLITMENDILTSVTSSLPNGILSFAKSFISGMGIILVSFVIAIYMLADYDDILNKLYLLLPKKDRKEYNELISNISLNARRVVNGTLLVALMVAVCDTIGFAIAGLEGAILFGLFCGITDLIPYIGPYIGGGVAVIVGFTTSPIVGIIVLVVAIIVQLLENYVLQPVVMSKAMQLHPLTIMIGLLLFGYFFGIFGMIFATPCMAILKEIYIFVRHKIEK